MLSTTSTYHKDTATRYYAYKCSKPAHHTKEHCKARDLPADALENLIYDIMKSLVADPALLDSVSKQMDGNNNGAVTKLQAELTLTEPILKVENKEEVK